VLNTSVGLAVALSGGGTAPAGLVADLGMDAAYESQDDGAGITDASLTITFRRDGTWTATKDADDIWGVGTTFSGNWALNPRADAGDDYSVLFTDTNLLGSLSITDSTGGAVTPLTSNQTFNIVAAGGASGSLDLQIGLRLTGAGANELTETTNLSAVGG
jgi:hypothetical protein